MKITEYLINFIFPKRCLYCGNKIVKGYACNGCEPAEKISCRIFNIAMGKNSRMLRIYSANRYGDIYRKSLHNFKFNYKKYLASSFAECISDRIANNGDYILTYVPMTEKKKRERGYNQSQLLAEKLGKLKNLTVKTLLIKKCENRIQHSLNKSERKENVKGVFMAVGDIKGQKIIIVDDIITTGSTMCECTAMLYRAGAADVIGVCCADATTIPLHGYNL